MHYSPIFNTQKNTLLHSKKLSGCTVFLIFYIPKIEGDMCTASWVLFSSFFWYLLVKTWCWTILPPPLGWNIMGYKSEPLPSYRCIRNCSYPIIFKYIYSHLCVTLPPVPRPVTTTSRIDYTLASPPTPCTDHGW